MLSESQIKKIENDLNNNTNCAYGKSLIIIKNNLNFFQKLYYKNNMHILYKQVTSDNLITKNYVNENKIKEYYDKRVQLFVRHILILNLLSIELEKLIITFEMFLTAYDTVSDNYEINKKDFNCIFFVKKILELRKMNKYLYYFQADINTQNEKELEALWKYVCSHFGWMYKSDYVNFI